VLWFDGSLRWNRQPGNTVVRVHGGSVFVHAERLYAVDVFTGRQLWQVELPSTVRKGSDFIAVEDGLFFIDRQTCLIVNPATGRPSRRIELPSELSQPWSGVRVLDQYLVGTSGKHVVCMNHRTGELMWKYECGRANLSIALGDGRVFCAELINKRRGETDDDGKTRALDIASGELLWEMASGSEIRYSQPHDLLVSANGVYGGTEVTQVLLKAGADVNAIMQPRKTSGKGPRRGTSPLALAVENGHFELAAVLLKAGADPNDQRSGFTPLHIITWVRKPNRGDGLDGDPAPIGSGNLSSLQFVRKLVARGADVNTKLKKG
jgi:outer membrane protein assembly factor BamB